MQCVCIEEACSEDNCTYAEHLKYIISFSCLIVCYCDLYSLSDPALVIHSNPPGEFPPSPYDETSAISRREKKIDFFIYNLDVGSLDAF